MKDLGTSNVVRESLKKAMEIAEKEEAKKKLQKEFADFDCSTLSTKTNPELAAWQARYPMDSPQYIIAMQEWNRRATVEQTKWMKRSVWSGFIGIIIGAILTAFIAWLLPPQKGENNVPPQNQPTENKTQQNTEKKNTDIKTSIRIKK